MKIIKSFLLVVTCSLLVSISHTSFGFGPEESMGSNYTGTEQVGNQAQSDVRLNQTSKVGCRSGCYDKTPIK